MKGKHTQMKDNRYFELRNKQQNRFNEWTEGKMFFAFSEEQFNDGMKEIGLDPKQDIEKIVRIPGGGYLLKKYRGDMERIFDEHEKEIQDLIASDPDGLGFVYEMFYAELANHEFSYTRDPDDALDALGLTYREVILDEKLAAGFRKACADLIREDKEDQSAEAAEDPEELNDKTAPSFDGGQIRPKEYQLFIFGTLQHDVSRDEDIKKAVFEAVDRFNRGDWGNLDPEDKEANNDDLRRRDGHVLARYTTPGGDIYINLIFDEPSMKADCATVTYCGEY